MRKAYLSDLTVKEWEIVKDLIPKAKEGGRPRTVNIREILNAIFYLTKSGCQWRMIPQEFPPMGTVYYYFRQWKNNGTIERIHDQLRKMVRVTSGKKSNRHRRNHRQSISENNRRSQGSKRV